ncbi:MAG: Gfo/Idh/MocA family oxidoreductase [Thaumarchaeota archaeon]|nr:Gfo/Idh/MocA family oxidoreductase [Nitrososphaerota archaeon]
MDSIRVGLVGFGRFGKIHASALALVEDVELTCICVSTRETAEAARKQLSVDVYSDYAEFLEKGRMDVVDIVSPNHLHAAQAIGGMESGRDILLEKPVAISAGEAKRVVDVQRRTSSVVHVGLEARYTPFLKAFKSSLEDGSIADPTFAKIESWRAPFRTGAGSWRYDGAKVGHQLLEEAIHHFDAAAWLFGTPESVWGFTDSPKNWDHGTFSTAVAVLEYPRTKVMIIDCLAGLSEHLLMEVSGEGAMIGMTESELDGSSSSSWIKKKDRSGRVLSEKVRVLSETENVALEIQDYFQRLRAGKEPFVTLDDGVRALSIDLAAIDAIRSGTRVVPSEKLAPDV